MLYNIDFFSIGIYNKETKRGGSYEKGKRDNLYSINIYGSFYSCYPSCWVFLYEGCLFRRANSEQEENFDSYYILQEQDLQEMGLSGIYFKRDNFYIVNYKTLEIIWTQGIKIGGKEYYKLSELEALEKEKNKVIEENEDI